MFNLKFKKMRNNHFLLLAILFCFSLFANAQSPVSGFMSPKGKGAVAISVTSEKYSTVLLHPTVSDAVPVFGSVQVSSQSLFGTYGISDKLNVVVGLPYITAKGNASDATLSALGFQNERKGVQDGSLYLKYNPYTLEMGENKINFIVAAGIKSPLGSYRVDEGLQSILAIGNRATNITGLAIAQFRSKSGFFVSTQAGYSYRTGVVPKAVIGEVKAGYGAAHFYIDAWYAGQISQSGVNILGEGFKGVFPETDVSYNRVGANIFVPIVKGFGISGAVSQYISGRNVGKSTGFSGSLIYSF